MHGARNGQPVILFDGVCNLCHAAVRFVARHDAAALFRFASLDSEAGRRLAPEALEEAPPGSVLLVDDAGTWSKSEAALRIAGALGRPWRWFALLRVVPRRLRDFVYDVVARNRYRWFGRKERCPLPEPDLRDRFLR